MPKAKDEGRRKFAVEDEAKAAMQSALSDHFEFWNDVKAKGPEGDDYVFDAVSRCRATGWVLGWEYKRSHLFKSEFADALRQGIHYRSARIIDEKLPALAGTRPPAIVLFPDWLGEHDDGSTSYACEAEGMRVLAAQLRVGTMRESKSGRMSIFMGQTAIWHSNTGWSKDADNILHGKKALASARKHDR